MDWNRPNRTVGWILERIGKMAEPLLVKSQRVMDFHSEFAGCVLFTQGEDSEAQVRLSQEDWAALGNARQITITIEPGDKLNGEAT
jgi:hypothetical protein